VLALLWLHRGGLDLWGAWLGGLLALLIWSKATAQDPAHWVRLLSPSALIAIAIGRIGSFASGCDYGRIFSPQFALTRALSEHARWPSEVMELSAGPPVWLAQVERQMLAASSVVSLPTHPVQLYEASLVAAWLSIALLHFAPGKAIIEQPRILLLGYSAIAFAAEWLRGDEDRGLIGPSLHGPLIVCLSTVLFALSLGIAVRHLGLTVSRSIQAGVAFGFVYGAVTWPIGQLLQHAPEGGRLSLAQCAALLMAAVCGFGAGKKVPQTVA
ncbi:MAG TPA: prolipoprotein diacylglyceryl transferase family protein, partial [Polyangiaceae bacterium]|nr:prolipoprotein diacylglyceryl transferase family protein [Polyangiaceae bacterium]